MNICKVEGCENKYIAKGYCRKHYQQLYQYGKILKRTIFDPNEIIKYDDYCEIVLYNNKHKEVGRAIIDKDDLEKVKKYKWYSSKNKKNGFYCATTINNKRFYLHHLILGKPAKGYEIDHRYSNSLDNRKQNLRFATHQKNMMNKKCKGYYLCENKKKWRSQIMVNQKQIHIGYFIKEEDAKKARKKAEIKYFKEFAYKIR